MAENTLQDAIIRDLQEANLVEFATSIGFFGTVAPSTSGDQHDTINPFTNLPQLNGSDLAAQQQQQQQHQAISSSRSLHTDQPLASAASDEVVVGALQALKASTQAVLSIVQSSKVMPLASSNNDGSGKNSRKSARTSVDQTAGGGGRCAGKGLRHFSLKVCSKVEEKGRTTYNEVADELVADLRNGDPLDDGGGGQFDEKNIRRRVYDAINVLLAMGMIEKEKKEITWKGFPNTGASPGGGGAAGGGSTLERLRTDRAQRIAEVERKQAHLQDLIEQHAAIKQLLQRNPDRVQSTGTALHLPFILVQAKPDATVEVKISEDMLDVQFDFYNSPFQLHDDNYVLKQMMLSSLAGTGSTQRGGSSPQVPVQSTASSLQASTLGNHLQLQHQHQHQQRSPALAAAQTPAPVLPAPGLVGTLGLAGPSGSALPTVPLVTPPTVLEELPVAGTVNVSSTGK